MRAIHLAVALFAVATAGCQMTTPFGLVGQPPPPTTGASYFGGYGTQLFPGSDDFMARTREAMDDLGLSKITEQREGTKTLFEARTVNGRRVYIECRPEHGNVHVSCRFGTLGDEALSRAFLDRMASRHGVVEEQVTDIELKDALSKPLKSTQRAIDQPPNPFDRQLSGGYRDTVLP